MKISCAYCELVEVTKLIPNPKNPNQHSDDQINRLVKIIKYQGQRSPIIVSKKSGFIVKGHGRLEAIKKLGWDKCAVDYQDYDDDAQEYADLVADNAIAEWSALNLLNIKENILDFENFDIDLLGLQNFSICEMVEDEEKETEAQDSVKKYILQIELPNEMEMRDLYDDLTNKGYLVKEV